LQARLAARVQGIPELRHVVHPTGPLAGPPLWAEDTDFRIEHHVVEAPLPTGWTDEAALLRFVEALLAPMLDRARPLWKMWCITGLPDRRLGLLLAWHHAMADGMGAVRLARALLADSHEERAGLPAAALVLPEPLPGWPELIMHQARSVVDAVRRSMDPSARRAARGILRALLAGWATTRREALTSLNDPVGPRRVSTIVRFDHAALRRIARRHGATINDIVLALVAGGVRELLIDRGEPIEHLIVRTGVAMALPPSKRRDAGANQFGGYAIKIPIGEPDPASRVRDIAAASDDARRTQPLTGMTGVRVLTARLPLIRRIFARQRYIQVMETLLPGPSHPLTLLDSPVRDVIPIQPLGRNVGLAVTASTYAGRLTIAVRADPDRFPDLDRFTAAIERDGAALAAMTTATATDPRH
jgi:diacylglycerol O-acyltransferase